MKNIKVEGSKRAWAELFIYPCLIMVLMFVALQHGRGIGRLGFQMQQGNFPYSIPLTRMSGE